VDGSQRLQLSSLPTQAFLPRWSPDGKQIAFAALVPGRPSKIHVVAADGGRSAQLTSGNHYETDPNWSPDQNSLVFGGVPWLEGGAPGSAVIHIFDLKTREVSTLSGSEGLPSPHWSPNGRYIPANVARFSETDAVRLQHSQVARIGKHSCGFPELLARWELHLL
jgi:Tol biopolymer transport system component